MSKIVWYRRLIMVMLCFITYASSAQSYQLHAVYIYSFIRYIQWPNNTGNFTIGVLGESPINSHLDNMAATKKAGSRTIVIKKFSSASEVTPTDILFIANSVEESVEAFKSTSISNNTLIITEKEGQGMAGSAINFIEKNSKLAFELNKSSIEEAGLKVSSELARLAIII